MPQGNDYQDFLKKNLNKADLIRVLNEFVTREVPRLHLDYSLVITLEKKAWEVSLSGVQNLSPYNHEEGDTLIMYHCTLEDKPTAVIASNTDILILTVHASASHLPDQDGFLQTNKNEFVKLSRIFGYIGNVVTINDCNSMKPTLRRLVYLRGFTPVHQ